MERYAEVAVDAPIGPERTLTYAIPPTLTLAPGHVLWVPLGPRLTSGVVFDLSRDTEVSGVRPVAALLDPSPVLSAQQLVLSRWLSRETWCSLYEAAAVVFAWGAAKTPGKAERVAFVERLRMRATRPLLVWHLGTTNAGDARHPLMLAYATRFEPWNGG